MTPTNKAFSKQIQDCVAETFGVSPIGLNEQMMVEIEPICECPCSSDELLEDDLLCQVNIIQAALVIRELFNLYSLVWGEHWMTDDCFYLGEDYQKLLKKLVTSFLNVFQVPNRYTMSRTELVLTNTLPSFSFSTLKIAKYFLLVFVFWTFSSPQTCEACLCHLIPNYACPPPPHCCESGQVSSRSNFHF